MREMLILVMELLILVVATVHGDLLTQKRQAPPPNGGGDGGGGGGGPDQQIFGPASSFQVARPYFWYSVGAMGGILLIITVFTIVALIKHLRFKRAVTLSATRQHLTTTTTTTPAASPSHRKMQSLLIEDEDDSNGNKNDDDDDLHDDGATPGDGVLNESESTPRNTTTQATSLSCALLNYYVDVSVPWITKLENLRNRKFPFFQTYTKQILCNISASFRPGTLTAILGPSGSGKTTFLNLLSGRIKTGRMNGYRLLNDTCSEHFSSLMRRNAGYVLQFDDTFFSDLTVEETLLYAAMLRLPSEQSFEAKYSRVQQVISEVQLEKVSNTKIGDSFTQGISGGQRRRLSIAMELLSVPSILLLDEPTSGLDANSAHRLVLLLKDLATHNRTVVTTIHSPRAESFAVFDNVLLLDESGKTVYFGSASNAVSYFQKHGFRYDKYSSPGDFIIDIVGLDPEQNNNKDNDKNINNNNNNKNRSNRTEFDVVRLEDCDEESGGFPLESHNLFHQDNTNKLSTLWSISDEKTQIINLIKEHYKNNRQKQQQQQKEQRPGFWEQTFILFSRRLCRARLSDQFGLFFQVFCVGIVLAFAFRGQGFDDINIFYRPYKVIMFIATVTSYVMIVQYLVLVPLFFSERNILRFEMENKSCQISSYIVSSILYETPVAILQVFLLCCIGYWLVDLNSEPEHVLFFGLTVVIGVCAWQSLVCLASFVTNNIGFVYTICFVFLGLGTLFGGLLIIQRNISTVFIPFYHTSVPALTYRTLLHNDLQCCYMFLTCSDVSTLSSKYTLLPPFFAEMTLKCASDSSIVMNLGGMALRFLDMSEQNEAINLLTLLAFLIGGRLVAIIIWKMKTLLQYKMKNETTERDLLKSIEG